ncbi:BTB/POZ and TAZ domain-containing protein 1-like isoform X1 [Vigna unguiculata]|uniref:Transcription factor n=2 Tax=Vigna unguiculata TaxID=3917 RepID=A0A4D6NM51_VIGUN|nr:BTB/POZ and TAZ domain-containing protein 1-like isoform X1 [Vigna unguiculata]QCE14893.1 transcription factor [Vigna unguiculata]
MDAPILLLPQPDLYLQTPAGNRIPAHATILASASPVLQNVIKSSNRIVKIHGVPDAAVTAFVAFLYSARCTEEDMDKYAMHLLALSHVYMVKQLKQRCIKGLGDRVGTENVVDVLQLARLCDAPDLYLKCARHLTNRFKAVKETEGWRFLQNNDPCLELEILCFMEEHEKRKRKARKRREDGMLYTELSEAMVCLEHICTEGCTEVWPYDVEVRREREPCSKFGTCQGLQNLIRHFATCERVKGRCLRCKRMWQLFRLHSSICLRHDACKVPLCSQIRLKMEQEKKKGDGRWEVLVRKVASAKAMSSLALPKRKRVEEIRRELP